jgi:hypothetical protein
MTLQVGRRVASRAEGQNYDIVPMFASKLALTSFAMSIIRHDHVCLSPNPRPKQAHLVSFRCSRFKVSKTQIFMFRKD